MSLTAEKKRPSKRERVVKNAFPWYSPRFWHGMRFSTWMKSLARNRFVVSYDKFFPALSISFFSVFNSGAAAVDNMVYGSRVQKTELTEPPIFILGHWRAGTTFLHELLIRDPSFTYATTYQCFAPHHFVLTDQWITPWTTKLLPNRRPMDNMAAGWQRPQEDEFALGSLGVPTPYTSMMFPRQGPTNGDYLDLQNLTFQQRESWKRQLLTFLQRISFCDPRRVVIKSPPHTARVRTLLEMFPDAKFVHIVRDPYALFVSTINLWKSLNEIQRMQGIGSQDWIEEYVLSSFETMYAAYEEDKKHLADSQLYELSYEDLVANPTEKVRDIYSQLNLGDFSRIEAPLEKHLAEVKNYRPNKFELAEEKRDSIRKRWGEYFVRYGYDV